MSCIAMKTTKTWIQNFVSIFQTESNVGAQKSHFIHFDLRRFWPQTSDEWLRHQNRVLSVGGSDTGVVYPALNFCILQLGELYVHKKKITETYVSFYDSNKKKSYVYSMLEGAKLEQTVLNTCIWKTINFGKTTSSFAIIVDSPTANINIKFRQSL